MKRITILMVLFLFGIGFAQSENFETGYIDILKKDIQTEAKNLVGENLEMTEDQANLFWPLYDDYTAELLELSNERLNVISSYMLDYYDLSDKKAETLVNQAMDIEQKRLDLKRKHIAKMNEVLPAKLVGKFFQIDNYLQTLVTIQRQSTIPFIKTDGED
ncbi:MAG: hypothetical protein BMS9Abin39_0054 [Ignavibacteria bacterium]|nr:MAG: hypothetical protein BMS9Abin39_0054 [Ignavibacteria bacterium]